MFTFHPNVRPFQTGDPSAWRGRAPVWAAAGAAALLAMSACSSATPSGSESPADASSVLEVSDAWVKATDGPMTGVFGIVVNPGADEITVTGATAPAAATVELHETVMQDGSMVMQPIEGGLVVPAGGQITLEPGGNHIMLMGLAGALSPGDEVPITLVLSSGGSVTFTAVAKEFAGANESYQPSPMATP